MLDRRSAADPKRGVHLGGDDHGQSGLAQAGRAGQQHVVGAAAAHPGGLQDEGELLADPVLADEIVQVLGPEGGLDGPLLGFLSPPTRDGSATGAYAVPGARAVLAQPAQRGAEDLRHIALRGEFRESASDLSILAVASFSDQPRLVMAATTCGFHTASADTAGRRRPRCPACRAAPASRPVRARSGRRPWVRCRGPW